MAKDLDDLPGDGVSDAVSDTSVEASSNDLGDELIAFDNVMKQGADKDTLSEALHRLRSKVVALEGDNAHQDAAPQSAIETGTPHEADVEPQ